MPAAAAAVRAPPPLRSPPPTCCGRGRRGDRTGWRLVVDDVFPGQPCDHEAVRGVPAPHALPQVWLVASQPEELRPDRLGRERLATTLDDALGPEALG